MSFEEPTPSTQPDGQPERFLEAVAAPLVKNVELQHAAKNVMRSMVLDPGALSDATRRMESKSLKWKRWLLPLLGFAAVLVLAAPSLWQVVKMIYLQESHYSRIYGGSRRSSIPLIKPDVFQTSRLSADEKMILLGDDDALTEEERLKAIVDRFPDRPEFYAEYAELCLRTNKRLPEDFDETVARIDPGNGYFLRLKGLEAGAGSMEVRFGGLYHIKFYIRDASKLEEANQWIHQAAEADKYRSYKTELKEQRNRLLPPRNDWFNSVISAMSNQPGSWRYYSDLVEEGVFPIAELEAAGKSGNIERFRIRLEDYREVQRKVIEDNPAVIQQLYDPTRTSDVIHYSAELSDKFKVEPEGSHLKELAEWVDKNPSSHLTGKSPPSGSDVEKRMRERASSFHRRAAYYSGQIPDETFPSNETLAPGRFAEHALWGRAASLMGVALLAALAWVMLLYRFRHGRLPRLVTHSLKKALRAVDYLWILVLGVGLPLIWHQVVRQSPWGGLDFNLEHGIEKLISPQWCLLALMVLMATTIAVRWRVKRRLRGIDLGIGRSAFTWICLLLSAATMPLMQYWIENPSLPDESMLVAGAVPALWLV
ncbi:MAG: hypothetical protein CFE26_13225, partial [Verrucomicrobiales bacterium VVV1]